MGVRNSAVAMRPLSPFTTRSSQPRTVSSHTPLPGEQDAQLGAFGLGFRYNRDNWFSLRVDYGFQVTEEGFSDGESGRWQVGATATF